MCYGLIELMHSNFAENNEHLETNPARFALRLTLAAGRLRVCTSRPGCTVAPTPARFQPRTGRSWVLCKSSRSLSLELMQGPGPGPSSLRGFEWKSSALCIVTVANNGKE